MTILAGELRIGNIVSYNGGQYTILKITHVKPGKGGAFYTMEMKDIRTGRKIIEKIPSEDKLEKLETTAREFLFSSKEGEIVSIVDALTLDRIEISVDLLNGFDAFLAEGMTLLVEYVGDDLATVKLSSRLVGEVGETDPHSESAAASSSYKEATLTNGFVLDIPALMERGTKIVVNPETGEFAGEFK